MRLILSVLAVALLVSGCSRERLVSRPGLTVVETEALPEPTRGDLVAADRPALVGPLDTIGIDVYGISDLSLEAQIDASGRISMPLAGTIDVRGKAAYEVARDIENALRGLREGIPPLSAPVALRMMEFFAAPPRLEAPDDALTGREREVLALIAQGKNVAETASLLSLSVHTVRGYVKEIYRKLGISSRAEASLRASKMGLIRD